MNLTSMCKTATLALVISSGAVTAPAAAQSAGDDVEMERIVIAMPNGKRIIRYVPRTTNTGGNNGGSNNDDSPGVRPPDTDGGDDDSGDDLFTPTDVPDDLARQVAQWLELYRSGNMDADINGDGVLDPSDYTALLELLNGNGNNDTGGGSGDGGGGSNSGGGGDDGGGDGDGGDGDGGDDDDGSNNSTEGWTELAPVAGSRVIYVSSSEGDDSNDGLSAASPVRSLSRGMSKLRNGQPDWLLFKRGDTFSGSFGRFEYSGQSADAPMVISAYGEGPRPKILTGTSPAFNLAGNATRKHVAIMSLKMQPSSGHPSGGIRIVTGNIEDFLIEDCYLKEYSVNILVQGTLDNTMDNIKIRRNILLDAMGTTHSQAIYASHIEDLTIEGNIIDRNGWDHRVGRSDATIFAHNCYIQRSVFGLVFKDNVVMRASSHGLQARMGGIIEGNVFYQNPMSIMFGNEGVKFNEYAVEGRIKHNVILEGIDINSNLVRGDGIVLQHTASVEVTDNILSKNLNEPGSAYGISIDGPDTAPVRNALISNNIFHDWDLPFRVHDYNAVSATFKDNVLYHADDDKPLIKHRRRQSVGNVDYMNNHYLRGGDQDWFQLGSTEFNLPEWRIDYAQQAQQLNGAFADGTRTFDSYARSIGLSNADALISEMRSMRKGDWDERFTPEAINAYFREGFAVVGVTN
jgi:hypothetical protein